jgi:hypothetical protein
MPVQMTSLERKNGDWFSRKAIPKDIRDAYKLAYGISQEERFRRPGSLSAVRAKQEFREWDATISGRIAALRAAANGEGQSLSHRQAHELAAQWYLWFTSKYRDEPGTPEQWDELHERLQAAYERFSTGQLDHREGELEEDPWAHPSVRRHVRAKVTELSEALTFLAEKAVKLTPESGASFLDVLEKELVAALVLLRRRASGDYRPDNPAP